MRRSTTRWKPRVGTAELRAALEGILAGGTRGRGSIARLTRRPSAYRSSFAIEELDLWLDDGTRLPLVWKNLSREALLPGARRTKPDFLHDPLREIEVYRTILASSGLSTAACLGAVVDPDIGRYWLFLERVPGIELYQVGEFATWQHAALWLAVLHARFAGRTDGLEPAQHLLLRYDGDFYRRWPARALAFAERATPSRNARRRLRWLASRYECVVERLVALPITFIHGEFYASNVLVEETPTGLRVCPVDWEMAAVGPGLIDLAALTMGGWTDAERAALALAYHAAQAVRGAWPSGDGDTAPEALSSALACCQLHVAVQWLGWSPNWSPPPEHAQDWLGEALRLAEGLDL